MAPTADDVLNRVTDSYVLVHRWDLQTRTDGSYLHPPSHALEARQGWPGTCGLSVSPHAQQRNSLEKKSQMEWGWGGSFQPKGFIRAKESPVSSSNWNFGLLLRGLSSIKENKKKRQQLSIAKTKVEINIDYKTEPGNWKAPNIVLFSWLVVSSYPLYPDRYIKHNPCHTQTA